MQKKIRISVYRILRKLGISAQKIDTDASLYDDILPLELEKELFFYMIESTFNITIPRNEEQRMQTLEDAILVVCNHVR